MRAADEGGMHWCVAGEGVVGAQLSRGRVNPNLSLGCRVAMSRFIRSCVHGCSPMLSGKRGERDADE